MRLAPYAWLLAGLCACTTESSGLPEEDAAVADSGGLADATPPDTGADSGEIPDLGGADPDAGFAPDAEPEDAGAPDSGEPLPPFSFFVTSLEAMRQLSGSQDGFGGNLSYDGATGLEGADRICAAVAELGMPGAGQKVWRAFLSASTGGANGGPVNAIERIGDGPWYDRNGRVVANDVAGLLSGNRPAADAQITNDLPNERGESQRNQPGTTPNTTADNHDVLTGSNAQGRFQGGGMGATCNDWTTTVPATGRPYCGHSWPAMSGQSWIRAHQVAGCAAVVNLLQNGPGSPGCQGVGCGGGYGALYCFALTP